MAKKKTLKGTSSLAGARGSTAGDVYHELWALRAALQLLAPRTDLKAVTVEGVAASAASEQSYAAVDCGLFYGAETLKTAHAIELIQLKYSTAKPNEKWTVAKLARSEAKTKNNSVIRGLAESFTDARKEMVASAKLSIRLESNQPISSEVAAAIAKLKVGDRTDAKSKSLYDAIGLKGSILREFLDALCFDGMGGESRHAIRSAISKTIADTTSDDVETQLGSYLTKIRGLMLPDAEREFLTRQTVLLWFGVTSDKGLYPEPAELQPLTKVIAREPAKEVIAKVVAGARHICLDGPAGCGKTTTMRQLEDMLPAGSITVLYDCYGAGRYLQSDHKRHLPEHAFLQIVNELAYEQGLPLFIPNARSSKLEIRRFKERVIQSANLLKAANPTALLAILLDAADNSANAANRFHEACFVWDIAQADLSDLPDNVVLVFSTRTGRKSLLGLPSSFIGITCPPFGRPETKAFVDAFIQPPVGDAWIDEFHTLSNHIPRVQAAAIKAGNAVPDRVLQSLMPAGKGLNDVLKELLVEASKKAGDAEFYAKFVTALSVLPPAIPVKHLAAMSGTTDDVVTDFVSDVWPWLRLDDAGVTISDEDLEDFLESEGKPRRPEIVELACAILQPVMDMDSYAATHICDLLVEAGRAQEVLQIVERDLEPKGIPDPIVKREVQLRRLRLAMNACASKSDPTDMLRTRTTEADYRGHVLVLRSQGRGSDRGNEGKWRQSRKSGHPRIRGRLLVRA